MHPKIALIKIAAIGDVTLACRALKEFADQYLLSDLKLGEKSFDLHWAIDQKLISLSKALLQHQNISSKLNIIWHPVDAEMLFQGSKKEQLFQALKIFRTIAKLQPDHIVLLHRDWRYKFLVRPAFLGTMSSVQSAQIHELKNYQNAFEGLASVLKLQRQTHAENDTRNNSPTNKIGLLVGGAKSAKLTYEEKRWPHLKNLISDLIQKTDSKIVFFGGPDDQIAADDLMNYFSTSKDRIENLVGKLQLSELPEYLAALDRFVSIDSGLAHIAASVMTAPHQKVVTLFGPTNPNIWAAQKQGSAAVKVFYKKVSCSPCYADDGKFKACPYSGEYFQHCMRDITTNDVFSEIIAAN